MTSAADRSNVDTRPRVLVCRGCCCGSERKHPDVDHEEQIVAISSVARTRVVDCVDECTYSNVVVVRPKPGESVWLGRLNSAMLTAELCDWLDAGAPQPLPPILEVFSFEPRNRTATE
ncbi:MAG: (2Fe-2S) ferredoxin domain-containing protein [Actinomycetota bacterium]